MGESILLLMQAKFCPLVWAARQFGPYLYGRQFLVHTDHNPLHWLHNFKKPEGQVAHWLDRNAF